MKKFLSILCLCLCLATSVGTLATAFTNMVYCDPDDTPAAGNANLSDLASKADESLNAGTDTLSKLAITIASLVMIIAFIMLMFTKDSKKTGVYIGMIITAAIALLGVIIVRNGYVVHFIQNIGDKYFK